MYLGCVEKDICFGVRCLVFDDLIVSVGFRVLSSFLFYESVCCDMYFLNFSFVFKEPHLAFTPNVDRYEFCMFKILFPEIKEVLYVGFLKHFSTFFFYLFIDIFDFLFISCGS